MVAYSAVIGVGIDLDHFVISRLHTGQWEAAISCLTHPTRVLFHQEEIFAEEEVTPRARMLSHLIVSGAVVALAWTVQPFWAGVSAAVLYAHLVTDAVADVFGLYQRR